MAPTLRPGDHVLVDLGAYRGSEAPETGDLVLAADPHRPELKILKRIRRVHEDGRFDLHGDNPDLSTDSRDYGPVPPEAVLGKVVSLFP